MMNWRPIINREWIRFCIGGKNEVWQVRAALPRAADFFSLFFLLVDRILSKESQVVLATLSRLMAAKMEKPFLTLRFGLTAGFQ